MTVINVFKYSPDKLKLHNSAHVDCSVLVSSQVRSRFIRRSSGNVTRVKARQSPLSPPDLAAQLQVEQRQKEAKSAGEENQELAILLLGQIRPYDGEDHHSLVVFDVEVELRVDFVHD